MPGADDWFYLDYRTKVGPLTADAIRGLAADGVLASITMVCTGADPKWRPLGTTGLVRRAAQRTTASGHPKAPRATVLAEPEFPEEPLVPARPAPVPPPVRRAPKPPLRTAAKVRASRRSYEGLSKIILAIAIVAVVASAIYAGYQAFGPDRYVPPAQYK